MIRTGLWQPGPDGLVVMTIPAWAEALTVGEVRALCSAGGDLEGARVWRTYQAIRIRPVGNKHSWGVISSVTLDSPLHLPLPDLEWRVSPWWRDTQAGAPAGA
jgi:hypothetical protein